MKPRDMASTLHDIITAIERGREGAEYFETEFIKATAYQGPIFTTVKSAQKSLTAYKASAVALVTLISPIMDLIHALESEE